MRRWTEDPLVLAGLLAAGAGVYVAIAADRTKTLTGTVSDVFTRGSKVTSSTMGADGVIVEYPMSLIAVASLGNPQVDGDVYSLARMIRSEGADQGEVRGHVALNDLANLGWSSLFTLLTYSTAAWAKGRYGKQYSAKYLGEDGEETWDRSKAQKDDNGRAIVIDHQTRRYSTSRDPYQGDLLLALKVIEDHNAGIDPTNGAVKFLDKSSMGVQQGSRSFETVNAQWTSEGLIAYTLPQYGDDLVLYRKS